MWRRFVGECYGFLPGRSTYLAAGRVEEIGRQGYRYVVDLTIKGFFDHWEGGNVGI
ncbi:MAG: hypothetical protein SV775_16845 [Thermodesulfobacteriota bacterium]|nr:hypothetical protein [Thermodesulfobacteriota bacterium]